MRYVLAIGLPRAPLLWMVIGVWGCERGLPRDARLPPGAKPPNVIFLLVDTLRADRLGAYGHSGGLTPTMDALAGEGVVFGRAIAPSPWTMPSIASLFCGVNPGVHQVTSYAEAMHATYRGGPKVRMLDETFGTLAERLAAGGYVTAAFVANPFILAEYGFAQGFDHFDASFANNSTPGNVVNDAALEWLAARDANKPFFIYLHYMDCHGPYDAAPEYVDPLLDRVEQLPRKRELTDPELRKLDFLRRPPKVCSDPQRHQRLIRYREYWEARYEAGVREMDHHLAVLRARLLEMGVWQSAYVILTADHGEALCEHGLWDHGFSVYDTDLHVPLVLRWPGVLPAGVHVAATVRLFDLMPTLLDQLRLPSAEGVQGSSLLDCITAGPGALSRLAFAEAVKAGPEQKALYQNEWKLMALTESGGSRVFNLASDPQEQTDLAGRHPSELAGLRALLDRQIAENAELARGVKVEHVPLSDEQLRVLQSLGYVGGSASDAAGADKEQSSDDPDSNRNDRETP